MLTRKKLSQWSESLAMLLIEWTLVYFTNVHPKGVKYFGDRNADQEAKL